MGQYCIIAQLTVDMTMGLDGICGFMDRSAGGR